jgi:amino acid permease
MLSPVRYGQRKFRAGGTSGSIFSLIAATLGSGTISFAYAVMMNGYVLGPILIVLGAVISFYTGMLIVRCSEKTGRTRYEDIALAIYGKRVARLTSFLNLICLIGFTFSYIVYIKKAVPTIIEMYTDNAPYWIQNNDTGNLFWGLLFSFAILFPMSIPRNASSLRFSSLFGVLCSMYLCLAVTFVFFTNKTIVPDPHYNLT